MTWETFSAHARGAMRSLTMWFGAMLLVLPDVLTTVQQNFPTFAPFLPEAMHSRVLNVIALGILLLRIRTTTSLAAKAAERAPPHDDGTAGVSQ